MVMDPIKLLNDQLFGAGGETRHKKRKIILDAAEKEFVKYGFKGTSIARIAKIAGLPRTNVHYYFSNKLELYTAVLTNIIQLWNNAFRDIHPDDDPKQTLSDYIDAKVEHSRLYPAASIIFASELLHGAPYLSAYLNSSFKTWINAKASVIDAWIEQGKMDPISPFHLLFIIWGATQHYAISVVEVEAALDRPLKQEDFELAKQTIKHVVLKGCGLTT